MKFRTIGTLSTKLEALVDYIPLEVNWSALAIWHNLKEWAGLWGDLK
jgi:hypothetical protein